METKDKIPAVCKPVVVNARNNLIAWLVVTGVVTFIFGGLAGMQLMQDKPKSEAVTGECTEADSEPGSAPFDQIQASVPVQLAPFWNGFTFTTPVGLEIDLPKNAAGEMAYTMTAGLGVTRDGVTLDAHRASNYFAMMQRFNDDGTVNPILHFDVFYGGDGLGGGYPDGDETVAVRYLGQTRNGYSILLNENEGIGEAEPTIYNRPYVSNLRRADLAAANYTVARADLWFDSLISIGESGEIKWSFVSGRTMSEMSEAQLAETIRILSSVR
jgi:hypothetical protein